MNFDIQALLPTEEDVAFYQQNGYYMSKRILSDDLIDGAVEGSEKIYRCEYDQRFEWSSNAQVDRNFGVSFTDRSVCRADGYASFHSLGIQCLVRLPIIAAIAATLSRSNEIRYWKDQLIYKPIAAESGEKEGVIGFHQDKRYWATCKSNKMITAWIPFHDCLRRNGCLVVIRGSHKWRNNHSLVTFDEKNMDFIKEKLINSNGEEVEEVPIELKKGHVSFHDCFTIHGSYANLSDSPRRTISVHLQDGDNRYRDLNFLNKEKAIFQHSHDLICRKEQNGFPDYSDPEIFPTLYRREVADE